MNAYGADVSEAFSGLSPPSSISLNVCSFHIGYIGVEIQLMF